MGPYVWATGDAIGDEEREKRLEGRRRRGEREELYRTRALAIRVEVRRHGSHSAHTRTRTPQQSTAVHSSPQQSPLHFVHSSHHCVARALCVVLA